MAKPCHLVFVHGVANKPAPDALRRIWLDALAEPSGGDTGFDPGAVGVSDSLVYWADLFYERPLAESEYESLANSVDELTASVAMNLGSVPEDPLLAALRDTYREDLAGEGVAAPPEPGGYERVPLPGFLKKRLMEHYVHEAHDYLHDVRGIRAEIRRRTRAAVDSVPEATPVVLVGHSLGSVIAYDVLTGVPGLRQVDGLLTLGSPLGVDEIQDELEWTREDGFPALLRGRWFNVYDSLDVVARPDPNLANDFRRRGLKVVMDVNEQSSGVWRHSATKYFKGEKLRDCLRELCGRK